MRKYESLTFRELEIMIGVFDWKESNSILTDEEHGIRTELKAEIILR